MSRTKLALILAGATVAGAVAGGALGVMFAPASGKETRRRLTWSADAQWRTIARASSQLIERAAARAREELENRRRSIADAMAAKVS